MRMLSACVLLLIGCASANVGNPPDNNPDGPPPVGDGPNNNDDDGPPPDGPPGPPQNATLQQTTNTTLAANNSVACGDELDGIPTAANSWFRVFSLTEAGITSTFNVSKVSFAVEIAQNEPPVTVKVGTYSGTPNDTNPLDLNLASFLANTTATIANTTTGITVDAPITATIPANGRVIVEITSTNRDATVSDHFYLGTTSGPFAHTSYIMATGCNINVPTAMAVVCTGCGASQAIMTISGTH